MLAARQKKKQAEQTGHEPGGGTGYLYVLGFQRRCLVGRRRDGLEPKRGLLKSSGVSPFHFRAFHGILLSSREEGAQNFYERHV